MKLLNTLPLCLLLATAALAQTAPALERAGEFQFDAEERVVAHALTLDQRLVMVGPKTVRVLDFASAKLTDPRPHNIPNFDARDKLLISPAGPRMLVVPRRSGRPVVVWDLENGRQLAALKTKKSIRAGLWSGDGRTLVTSSNEYAPFAFDATSVEVTFWDGETLARLGALPSDKVGWWHLTADGLKCFFLVGDAKNYLFIIKYINPPGAEVRLWDVRGNRVEQTVKPGDGSSIRAVHISPGEKYLAFAARPPKSDDGGRWVAVYEIDKSASPRYELRPKHEIRPVPTLPLPGAMFSPGSKYFAVDAGRRARIYESAGGEKRLELADFEAPNGWLNDETFLRHFNGLLKAYDVATGKLLYEQKQVYDTTEYTEPTSYSSDVYDPGTTRVVVDDQTHTRAHPAGRVFLTYSNRYVKVFDTRTGALLQEPVAPPMDYTGKKPRLSDKSLVFEAGWSYDGRTLYVLSADKKSVSLWRLLDS